MNFNLTEEHLMIKDAARNFAETELLPRHTAAVVAAESMQSALKAGLTCAAAATLPPSV